MIQLGDLSITTETNLLSDKGRLGQIGSGRVVEAQIAFKTHLAVPDITQSSLSKSISLGVTMAVESSRTAQKTHTLHTFSLRYDDFRVSMDGQDHEDAIVLNLATNSCELLCTRQQVFA